MSCREQYIFATADDYDLDAVKVESSPGTALKLISRTATNYAGDNNTVSDPSASTVYVSTTAAQGSALTNLTWFFKVGDIVYLSNDAGTSTDYLTVKSFKGANGVNVMELSLPINVYNSGNGFSVYLMKNYFKGSSYGMTVDVDLRNITKVDLLGYYLAVKSVSVMAAHEGAGGTGAGSTPIVDDDWYALRIPELEKYQSVKSNNMYANGAYAVLPAQDIASSSDDYDNKKHALNFLPQPFTCTAHQGHIQKLHVKLLDRRGNPANVSRVHLWFRFTTKNSEC